MLESVIRTSILLQLYMTCIHWVIVGASKDSSTMHGEWNPRRAWEVSYYDCMCCLV